MPDDTKDFRQMTAATVGTDLLQALVQELKLLPDVWAKMSKTKQDDVIDRLRNRVDSNIKMAVHVLASQGRTTVIADLDSVTIKDGIKAVFKISGNADGRHALVDSEGQACLIVLANPGDHTAGMDAVQGEADQRGLDLGKEYTDEDGAGMPSDGGVIDVQAIEHTFLQSELDDAQEQGYAAAAAGKSDSETPPAMPAELVKCWIRGWNMWHEDNGDDNNDAAFTGDAEE